MTVVQRHWEVRRGVTLLGSGAGFVLGNPGGEVFVAARVGVADVVAAFEGVADIKDGVEGRLRL